MSSSPFRRNWAIACQALALGVLTFLLYLPVRDHDSQIIDDPEYVFQNQHVATGLNFSNVGWAFTAVHSNNWHPVTWLSHMLDCQLFGLNPGMHLLVNSAFHTANSLLLLALLL